MMRHTTNITKPLKGPEHPTNRRWATLLFLISYFLFLISPLISPSMAQPAKRRTQTISTAGKPAATAKQSAAEKKSDRAALMFPTSAQMPEDVVWRRDIYRQLDLLADKNAPLYYPVEPHGKEQNLFTYIFRLWLSGRINVYNYKIDGNESFDDKDKADVKELLERYRIYYEEDGNKITVPESDIPSAQVTRYYIKESVYFDQRSATYKARVTAFCPVLMEGDDFMSIDESSSSKTPKPLFWVKYDDVASYLSRLPLMASNLNNVTNMTVDDYFILNRYDGKIYKTNNMQGRVLANYAQGDSAMSAEQARIEKQLTDFENNIWHSPETRVDSAALLAAAKADSVKVSKTKARATRRKSADDENNRRAKASEAAASKKREKSAASSGGGSSAPRVSARRQRR